MASVNKVILDPGQLRHLYLDQLMSLPMVASALGASTSTVRARLKEMGILRTRRDAIRLACAQGRGGRGLRGKRREFTDEWKRNIAAAARKRGDATAAGYSIKPSGYLEHTRGPNKGRALHVTTMEAHLGRRISVNEVVHHIDHNRANNLIYNLQLMSRSEHAQLHAAENTPKRQRATNGQFK